MATRMSDRFEEAGPSRSYAALPESFRTPLLGAIIGVRLQIDRGHAKGEALAESFGCGSSPGRRGAPKTR